MMKFKWQHSKATYVTLFLEESQEMEAWNKLSFSLDQGKEDLGTFVLTSCEESYPQNVLEGSLEDCLAHGLATKLGRFNGCLS